MNFMKTTLVILTRNEIEGMKALFDRIPFDKIDETIVVDYKSKDGTREFLQSRGVKVIDQEIPGRVEAFRLAVEKAQGDVLIFFSPDGNENPRDIPLLADLIKQGYDMAIASRFLPGALNEESGKLLPLRLWANKAFTFLANLFFGGNISDSINGFRAMRRDKFMDLHVDASGYAIEYQMSIRALKKGYRIKEIPTIEGQRIGGESGAKAVPVGLKILKLLIREIFIGKKF